MMSVKFTSNLDLDRSLYYMSEKHTDSSFLFVTKSRIHVNCVPGSNDQTSVTPGPAILKICRTFICVKFSRRQKTMYFLSTFHDNNSLHLVFIQDFLDPWQRPLRLTAAPASASTPWPRSCATLCWRTSSARPPTCGAAWRRARGNPSRPRGRTRTRWTASWSWSCRQDRTRRRMRPRRRRRSRRQPPSRSRRRRKRRKEGRQQLLQPPPLQRRQPQKRLVTWACLE